MTVVWVPNKSFHDFTDATRFGKLEFLTDGKVNIKELNTLTRDFVARLRFARPDDYILVTSMGILTSLLTAIVVQKFGQVNFLIWDPRQRKYLERTLRLKDGVEKWIEPTETEAA